MGLTRLRGMDLWAAPSRSRPGVTHLVRWRAGEGYRCSCEAGSYRSWCRHVGQLTLEVAPCPEGHSRYEWERGLGFANECSTCERTARGER